MKRFVILIVLLLGAPVALALDSRTNIDKAIDLIEAGEHSLARSYLAPALIDPRLSSGERSRAYYLRGYSFGAQDLLVSARKDFYRSLEFNPDNPAVLFALGRLHYFGNGTEVDHALGVSLFEQAIEHGHKQAKFQLAYAYLKGEGVEQDVPRARELLLENANEGDPASMMQLAMSYRTPGAAYAQPELAREWYEKAIAAGEPKAYLSLGYMHGNGELGEPDLQRGVANYQLAADAGVAPAFLSLGHAYLNGIGVGQDYGLARAWYEKAAFAGVAGGYLGLGHIFQAGLGVESDLEQALRWYQGGAERGDLNAQLRSTYLLLNEGSPEARVSAIEWLKKAVAQGSAQAYNAYAWLLATSKWDDLRNGTLAVSHAKQALAQNTNPAYMDTLAAAYAENGQFTEAVATQMEALQLVAEQDLALRTELETHLIRYERSEPWRE